MAEYPNGIRFPFRFAAAGGVDTCGGGTKVMSNLKALVLTTVNERLIRKVGTIGYQQVLRSSLDSNSGAIESLVRDAVVQFEPRAVGVEVSLRSEDIRGDYYVFIDVSFVFKFTGDPVKATIQVS